MYFFICMHVRTHKRGGVRVFEGPQYTVCACANVSDAHKHTHTHDHHPCQYLGCIHQSWYGIRNVHVHDNQHARGHNMLLMCLYVHVSNSILQLAADPSPIRCDLVSHRRLSDIHVLAGICVWYTVCVLGFLPPFSCLSHVSSPSFPLFPPHQ